MKYLLILMLGLSGCYLAEEHSIESIHIDTSVGLEIPSIIDFESIELLPIGAEDYPLVFELTRGKAYDSIYVFADSFLNGNLILTSNKGDFLQRINHLGPDPQEYLELTDFLIDSIGNIMIYDFQKQVINTYDLLGNYISKRLIGYNFRNFQTLGNSYLLFTAKHSNYVNTQAYNYDLLQVNDNEGLISKNFSFNEKYFRNVRLHSMQPFHISNGTLHFNDILNDTLFQINQYHQLVPKIRFSYKQGLSPSKTEFGHMSLVGELSSKSKNLIEKTYGATVKALSDRYIVYSFLDGYKKRSGIYSLKTKTNRVFKVEGESPIDILDPFFSEGEKFIVVLPFYLIEKYFTGHSFFENLNEAKGDPEKPILVKYELKDF